MDALRRHPILSGIAVAILVICLGSYLGQAIAIHHTHEIGIQVRAHRPDDPLDGLWIIGLWITIVGSIIATVIGVGAGLIAYLALKRFNV